MKVKISNLFRINEDYKLFNPTHIISIIDPRIAKEHIPTFLEQINLLQLYFYDDDDLSLQEEPIIDYIIKIVQFLDTYIRLSNAKKSIMIHCHAGASRSPAILYLLYGLKLGPNREQEAFIKMLGDTNKPWPSRFIISLADTYLQRNSKLLYPLDDYQHLFPNRYKAYVRLNRKRNLNKFLEVS